MWHKLDGVKWKKPFHREIQQGTERPKLSYSLQNFFAISYKFHLHIVYLKYRFNLVKSFPLHK